MTSANQKTVERFARGLCWFFLAGSILALCYTYYRAEIVHHGDHDANYFKYYLGALTAIVFWGVILRLRAGIQANIVTVAVSLVVGLYLAEGGIILLKPSYDRHSERVATATKQGVAFDQRTKVQVIADLNRDGVDAVMTMYPYHMLSYQAGMDAVKAMVPLFTLEHQAGNQSLLSLLPLGGISNKTTVGTNEGGQYPIYQSDRYGFNNPDAVWDLPQIEWLLTGDSFTHGHTVQAGEDIAGQIRAITNSTAINLGMSGNGPLLELAALKEYAEPMRPQKVLWVYYEGNDLISDLRGDLRRERQYPLLMNYLEDGFTQDLINRQAEIDRRWNGFIMKVRTIASRFIRTKRKLTKWILLHEIRELIFYAKPYKRLDLKRLDLDPLFTSILAKAKTRTEAWGGQFYFVYLPKFGRYGSNGLIDHEFRFKKADVIDAVQGLNIPVIDIHQAVFAEDPDPLALFSLRIGVHYNAAGYQAVAKAIVTEVAKIDTANQ